MNKVISGCVSSVLLLSLVGCAGMSNQDVGVITGGAIGGIVGSQFGSGSGKILAAVGGTVLGAVIGGAIGKDMDRTDRLRMMRALEQGPTGRPYEWHNPDTGYDYAVTPTRTYYVRSQPCREYTTRAIIGGKSQEIYGKACRTADGAWRVVS